MCLDSSVSFQCFMWFHKDAVISISFCEVSCQSYVSLSRHSGCDSSLIHNFVFRGDSGLSFCNCIVSRVLLLMMTCNW